MDSKLYKPRIRVTSDRDIDSDLQEEDDELLSPIKPTKIFEGSRTVKETQKKPIYLPNVSPSDSHIKKMIGHEVYLTDDNKVAYKSRIAAEGDRPRFINQKYKDFIR